MFPKVIVIKVDSHGLNATFFGNLPKEVAIKKLERYGDTKWASMAYQFCLKALRDNKP